MRPGGPQVWAVAAAYDASRPANQAASQAAEPTRFHKFIRRDWRVSRTGEARTSKRRPYSSPRFTSPLFLAQLLPTTSREAEEDGMGTTRWAPVRVLRLRMRNPLPTTSLRPHVYSARRLLGARAVARHGGADSYCGIVRQIFGPVGTSTHMFCFRLLLRESSRTRMC